MCVAEFMFSYHSFMSETCRQRLFFPLDYHRHAGTCPCVIANPTLTIEEFVVAAGFGLPDDTLHPPIRDLNVEALVGIRRMQGYILPPLFLGAHFIVGGHGSTMQLAFSLIASHNRVSKI